jgi:hypothetical protein
MPAVRLNESGSARRYLVNFLHATQSAVVLTEIAPAATLLTMSLFSATAPSRSQRCSVSSHSPAAVEVTLPARNRSLESDGGGDSALGLRMNASATAEQRDVDRTQPHHRPRP